MKNVLKGTVCRFFDNGLRTAVLQRRNSMVEIAFVVKSGSANEGEFLGHGVAHMVEHNIFKGCRNYPGKLVSERVAELDGQINAYTSNKTTAVTMTITKEHIGEAVKIISNMVRYPYFDEAEFLAEREVILREVSMCKDTPERRLMEIMGNALFPNHPAQIPVIGYMEKIAETPVEALREFHREHYIPNNSFWVVCGDIDPQEFEAAVEAEMGDWQRGVVVRNKVISPTPPFPQCHEFVFPDKVSRLLVAHRLPDDLTTEQFTACSVIMDLAMRDSSPLISILRRQKQYMLDPIMRGCGEMGGGNALVTMLQCQPDKIDACATESLQIFQEFLRKKFTDAEVRQSVRSQYAHMCLNEPLALMFLLRFKMESMYSPDFSYNDFAENEKITGEAVRQFADYLLNCQCRVIVKQRVSAPAKVAKRKFDTFKPTHHTSKSGLNFTHIHDTDSFLSGMHIILPGEFFVPEKQRNAARFIRAIIDGGTSDLDEDKLAEMRDKIGIECYALSGMTTVGISCSATKRILPKAVDYLNHIFTDSVLPEPVFQRILKEDKSKCLSNLQNSEEAASAVARQILFGEHIYTEVTADNIDKYFSVTREDCLDFFHRALTSPQVKFGFWGDVDAKKSAELCDRLWDGIGYGSGEVLEMPTEPKFITKDARKDVFVDREQAAVTIMMPGTSVINQTEFAALNVLLAVENGLDSQLFDSLRNRNSLAYSVYATTKSGFQRGYIQFTTVTQPSTMERAEELMRAEIRRIAGEGVTAAEFEKARLKIMAREIIKTNNAEMFAPEVILDEFYGKSNSMESTLKKLTLKQANSIFARLFTDVPTVTTRAGRIKGAEPISK